MRIFRQFFAFVMAASFLAFALFLLFQLEPVSLGSWGLLLLGGVSLVGMTFWLYRFLMGAQFDPTYMHDQVTDDFAPGVGLGSSVRRQPGDDGDDLF